MSNSFTWIILIGMLCVILTLVIGKSMHKDGNTLPKYDERQKLDRGRGYMIAFYSMAVLTCLIPVVLPEKTLHFLGDTVFMFPPFIGLMIHIGYCVWKDAYIELNLNESKWTIFILMIGCLNLLIAYSSYRSGRMVMDGVLQFHVANLIVGAMAILIVLEIAIRKLVVGKGGDDDEESEA